MSILKTTVVVALLAVLAGGGAAAQHKPSDTPVEFSATVQATGPLGSVATTVQIHILKYTEERDRKALLAALVKNGYQAFLPALRAVPTVGYVQIKEQKWNLKWAHQQQTESGQSVTVATDQPIFFVGGGSANQKPRAGYELAVIRLEVDSIGMGKGSMAAAAKVKPAGDGQGVVVDDYADKPLPITMVSRIFS
jgi:hypothetical protein